MVILSVGSGLSSGDERSQVGICIGSPCSAAVVKEKSKKATIPAREFLPNINRIVFLGDSITYDGRYVSYFETQWRLHLRERPIEIISCGLPSETVSGLSEDGHAGGKFPRPDLHERLGRVLKKTRPDLVFACYGMNDGIYLPLSAERFARFKSGIVKLHEQVKAAGARIVHLTPPVFDALPIKGRVAPSDKVTADRPYRDYDDVLEHYTGWLLKKCEQGWHVIDFHGAMKAELRLKRRGNVNFTFAPDGVHPNESGQMLLGKALVDGIGAPFRGMTSRALAAKVFQLVHERRRLLTDAWLTEIGHKRPMAAGLPLETAQARAVELEKRIEQLLR
ncbi:MAG: SGNH/GDSL hydrolase family protein [Planctomycetes bacterium]|nr:SGNH/GDSL hydrolase family protein [Planctomycetota bacterium]